jgi:hypothetical protein
VLSAFAVGAAQNDRTKLRSKAVMLFLFTLILLLW